MATEAPESVEAIKPVEIDATTLTPLSPEVISKQVRIVSSIETLRSTTHYALLLAVGYYQPWYENS